MLDVTIVIVTLCWKKVNNMKCESCEHQRVCWIYKDHISKIIDSGIEITIDKCREFDEVK
jgi:hypothetical protein